jgi:hypothetical protein
MFLTVEANLFTRIKQVAMCTITHADPVHWCIHCIPRPPPDLPRSRSLVRELRIQVILFERVARQNVGVHHLIRNPASATVMDEDRSGARQHIVGVVGNPPLPAFMQVNTRVVLR